MSNETPNALGDAKRWMAGQISLGRFVHNSGLELCYAQACDFAGGIANAYEEKLDSIREQRRYEIARDLYAASMRFTDRGDYRACNARDAVKAADALIEELEKEAKP